MYTHHENCDADPNEIHGRPQTFESGTKKSGSNRSAGISQTDEWREMVATAA
jgi:hypothetical protein